MRSLATYVLAALLLGLALDFIAPGQSISNASNRWPSIEQAHQQQVVERSGKGDRLDAAPKSNVDKSARETPRPATPVRTVMEGCDPAFSPLSAARASNFASRCVV